MIKSYRPQITDKNKIINTRCCCDKVLPWIKLNVVMLDPCEHLVHEKCFLKCKTDKCPICKTNVDMVIHKDDYKQNPLLYQKCIDILSMTNFDHMSDYDPTNFFENIPSFIGTVCYLFTSDGKKYSADFVSSALSLNDTTLCVKGLSKIKNEKKIFISNHTTHLDSLVLYHLLKSGYLASTGVHENILVSRLTDIVPTLVVDRTKKGENTVEKIKEYVKKMGSLIIYSEGMLTHPNCLIRLRTGAFYAGFPIYPVVINYDPVVGDMDIINFFLKLSSQQKVKINVQILDPVYPPFDDNKIEQVRIAMAKAGNLLLSRVSNKDIKETFTEKDKSILLTMHKSD